MKKEHKSNNKVILDSSGHYRVVYVDALYYIEKRVNLLGNWEVVSPPYTEREACCSEMYKNSLEGVYIA